MLPQKVTPYLFILPAIAIFGLFLIFPTAESFYLSFTSWDGLSPEINFVGSSNFQQLTQDPLFINALANNIVWIATFTSLSTGLGLLLAILLETNVRGANVFKTIVFLPLAVSLVVSGIVWSFVYDPDFGSLNGLLKFIGLSFLARGWLGDPTIALFAVITAATWVWTGFSMVIFSAGLKAIPQELIEAATIDGAGSWKRFTRIVLPLLTRPMVVVITLTIMWSLKLFDLVFVMTRGGPFNSTEIIALFMWNQAFRFSHAGYGSAVAVVLFLIILVVAVPYLRRITRRAVEY